MIQISTEPSRTGLIEEDWPTMEANYWHDTKKARDREDARLAHEHSSRQELLDQGLTELYNKKLDLQKAMNEVNTNIESQMADKQRLSHEYETSMAILLS